MFEKSQILRATPRQHINLKQSLKIEIHKFWVSNMHKICGSQNCIKMVINNSSGYYNMFSYINLGFYQTLDFIKLIFRKILTLILPPPPCFFRRILPEVSKWSWTPPHHGGGGQLHLLNSGKAMFDKRDDFQDMKSTSNNMILKEILQGDRMF